MWKIDDDVKIVLKQFMNIYVVGALLISKHKVTQRNPQTWKL
jgi:hypothetical protein